MVECFEHFEKTGSQSKIFQKRNWKSARSLPEKKWLTTKLSVRESEFKLRSPAKSFPQRIAIMKKPSISILIALVLFAVAAQAQTPESDPIRRPRVVGSKVRASAKFQSQSPQSQTPTRPHLSREDFTTASRHFMARNRLPLLPIPRSGPCRCAAQRLSVDRTARRSE